MKIDFEFQTEYGKFADALHFSDDEPLPSEEEIEAMKQQRLNSWIAAVSYVPTEEELAQMAALQAQAEQTEQMRLAELERISKQIAELQAIQQNLSAPAEGV